MQAMYKYLCFGEIETNTKTRLFSVKNKRSDFTIGYVKWYGPWRKYCFLPNGNTVFDAGCLADIQDFLNELMAEWKAERKKESEGQ